MSYLNIYTTAALTGGVIGATAGVPLSALIMGFASESPNSTVKTMALAFTVFECACAITGAALGAGSVYFVKDVVPLMVEYPQTSILLGGAIVTGSIFKSVFNF